MENMSYNYRRVSLGRRCHGGRGGFRVNSKRFSVQRLKLRLMYWFRLLSRWRCSCGQALESIKKGMSRRSKCIGKSRSDSNSRTSLVIAGGGGGDCRFRSFGRTNSFYSEAIADCLEFIKRSSISVDDITEAIKDRPTDR